MNKYVKIAIIVGIQFLFLLLMIGGKVWHVSTGEKALIEIEGYDPMDLFRGYYTRINPLFNESFYVNKKIRIGQSVYAPYEINKEGIAVFGEQTIEKPTKEKYLKGEVARISETNEYKFIFRDEYGKEYEKIDYSDSGLKNGTEYMLCIEDWGLNFYDDKTGNCSENNAEKIIAKLVSNEKAGDFSVTSNYYIDSFYGSYNKSQEIEDEIRKASTNNRKSYASVAINSSGKATIIDIVFHEDEK